MDHSSQKELKPTILKAYQVGREGIVQDQGKGRSFNIPRLYLWVLKGNLWAALPGSLCHTLLLLQKSTHGWWLTGAHLGLY